MADIDGPMGRDETWFRSLHARTADDVTRFALRRAASRADAEDAVADAYLVAWRRREAVPEPPEDALWLYGVTRNALANLARGARRRERLRLRLARERPPEHRDADVGEVAAALARLPEQDAELLRLLAWEGLSHREAAVVLETTENAVALRASRARRRLRELMTGTAVGWTWGGR